ncbi:hypothetical protein ACFSKU_10685 [Pontibacter silvestris]|uniref:DKNYY family protein n=1 Tax=Pontibacter silvestris TaxID=2305183 RepID=A0ABW4WYP5_9BACT|nr:hypothetical protein [Pontibacter silvestris]MCC9138531.1 hypothetical protein [Pontibacter silvestris]
MKQLYIALLLLFYCTLSFAQQDYRKGYIIQGSDTLRGYVDYRGDSRSAQFTTFKQTLNGDEKRFTPNDIAGYGFENENRVFESKQITLTDSAKATTQKLFLNTLVRGRANLYHYRDNFFVDHYYLEKDTLFEELLNRKIRQTNPVTGRSYEHRETKYIGVLNYAFLDCQAISMSQLQHNKSKPQRPDKNNSRI